MPEQRTPSRPRRSARGDAHAGETAPSLAALAARLAVIAGVEIVADLQERRTYESDALGHLRATPGIVVIPTDRAAVQAVVRACAAEGVSFVARGSGTGLSGGALPVEDGVLLVTSRLVDVIDLDLPNRRAVVGPGVVNAEISRLALGAGLFYAPDPSSGQVCSIGGNVAENSGGAHCLKYGFTTNHVTGIEIVTPDGELVTLGSEKAVDAPGYDLVGTIVGSEGTLGVVTAVSVRLVRLPERVETLLCAFETIDQAAEAVAAIVASGVVPAAIEMMDSLSIEAAEEAVGCGYPRGAGAVLIVELDGPSPQVEDDVTAVMGHCRDNRAFEMRLAADDAERAQLWKGRKSAFAAMGRISADYIVQDGVVPRSALRAVLHQIGELADEARIRVANVFHAGDGNLHPLVLFDDGVAGERERAETLSSAILDLCLRLGGSITGEHGVGVDKKAYMGRMFGEDDLETMHLLRCAFDPEGRCNPGKVFPTPRLCGEVPGHHRGVHPLQAAGIAEIF